MSDTKNPIGSKEIPDIPVFFSEGKKDKIHKEVGSISDEVKEDLTTSLEYNKDEDARYSIKGVHSDASNPEFVRNFIAPKNPFSDKAKINGIKMSVGFNSIDGHYDIWFPGRGDELNIPLDLSGSEARRVFKKAKEFARECTDIDELGKMIKKFYHEKVLPGNPGEDAQEQLPLERYYDGRRAENSFRPRIPYNDEINKKGMRIIIQYDNYEYRKYTIFLQGLKDTNKEKVILLGQSGLQARKAFNEVKKLVKECANIDELYERIKRYLAENKKETD